MGARVGVDVGGTNTDLVLESDRGVFVHKVQSTPHDQSVGVLKGLLELCEMAGVTRDDIDVVVHGTTVATNITIEHTGAEVGMLTTRNFRDILHIARHKRPHNFSLHFDVPWQSRPLVKRRNRIAVTERILPPDGRVGMALDENDVLEGIRIFKKRGIRSVVVAFIFSFMNDEHEQRARAIVEREMPEAYVCCSSDVANVLREYERFSTAAMNAFIGPKTSVYLANLRDQLARQGFRANLRLIQSNGGVSTVEACSKRAVNILMSGPAGGVIGGRAEGLLAGADNVITVDIGGTSADISTVPAGRIKIMNPRDSYVSGHPILVPMIDLVTIGAGGGSIAYIDSAGGFHVGPRSAGADPGPACYGKGGDEPTVTDAQVALGRLDADKMLGGDLPIDPDLASRAIEQKVGKKLGLSVKDAALGIIRVINSNMALAIRSNSVARGVDPREFSLVPFGGAGPLHGVALAEAVSARDVLVPVAPGITAAMGLLETDMQYEHVRSFITSLTHVDEAAVERLNTLVEELVGHCRRDLENDGFYTSEAARSTFGVVVDLEAERVDEAATEAARRALRARPAEERVGAGTDLGPAAAAGAAPLGGTDRAPARASAPRDTRPGTAVAQSSAAIGRRARAAAASPSRDGGRAAPAGPPDMPLPPPPIVASPRTAAASAGNGAARPNGGTAGNGTARSLNARYRDGWSFEIVGYHLGDDEVEVTGQLRANGSSVQRTARGNGRDLSLGEQLKRASDACLRDCATALEARP